MRHDPAVTSSDGNLTLAYTDGACSGNPGPGGWAWAVPGGRYASGAEAASTNQRMELTAAFEAVRAIEGPLEVVSDSTYVVNCFRDRWYEGWHRRGWKNSKKEPVANRDLWEPFIDVVLARGDVTFRWVKGHSDDPMNDLVDRLAVEAATTQEGRAGEGEPDDLGPPDAPGSSRPRTGSGRDRRLPDGRLVLVAGHRPSELGGSGDNPVAEGVRTRLGELLAGLVEVDGPLHVVSGLRLGAEQLGAEAALAQGLPVVAVLPYPAPDSPWPPEARRRFADTLGAVERTITLDAKVPTSKQGAGIALGKRDDWLARQVDSAVVVWDQADAAVGRLVRVLEDHLGPDQVLLVQP
jgi:ribonuclease HI